MAFVVGVLFALLAFFDRPIPRAPEPPGSGAESVREA